MPPLVRPSACTERSELTQSQGDAEFPTWDSTASFSSVSS